MTKGIISVVWKLWERKGSCRLKCWRVQKVIVIVHFSSNQLYNDRCVKSRGGSDWQRWGGFLCHERQWQPFCPPATNYGGVDDGQDGARGSKQVSCRQLQLFQSESLDSKYFQSIGRERSNRWHCMCRKAGCQVKATASKPETSRVPLHRDYNRWAAPRRATLFQCGVTARWEVARMNMQLQHHRPPLTRGHNGCDWRITGWSSVDVSHGANQPSSQLLFVWRVKLWLLLMMALVPVSLLLGRKPTMASMRSSWGEGFHSQLQSKRSDQTINQYQGTQPNVCKYLG